MYFERVSSFPEETNLNTDIILPLPKTPWVLSAEEAETNGRRK